MKSKRVDALLVPLAIALTAMLSIGAAVVWHQWLFWLVTVLFLICLGLYLNASWRGKEQIIDETITYLHLSSDAQVLDLGTDQGKVLVKLAKRLTIPGHATGVEVSRIICLPVLRIVFKPRRWQIALQCRQRTY